jgi:hypothetical protein
MPTKKRLGGKVSYKKRALDTSGLGYQRAKEIESNKAQQATNEKMNRALDAILRKENIKKPTMQEKQEAQKKLMDDTAQNIITNQRNDLMQASKDLLNQMNQPKPRKPRIPKASIKQSVLLNSPATFKSEPLPSALLPPTTKPEGIVKSTVKKFELDTPKKKNNTKGFIQKHYSTVYPDMYAPRLNANQQNSVMLSPLSVPSMPQITSKRTIPLRSQSTLDLPGHF